MRNVRPGLADVSAHLPHDSDVVVAVEKRILVVRGTPSIGTSSCPIRLQSGIAEYYN